jgi:hypothetical protein
MPRFATHGRDIAQPTRDSVPADIGGRVRGPAEVDVFDVLVSRDQQILAAMRDDGAVVPDAGGVLGELTD